jgi:hypothetical protein
MRYRHTLAYLRGGPWNSDSMLRWLPPFDRRGQEQ